MLFAALRAGSRSAAPLHRFGCVGASAVSTGWSDTQLRTVSRSTLKSRRPNRNPTLNMKLLETVPGVGVKGETVTVTRGFGRDFLIPRKLAKYDVDAANAKGGGSSAVAAAAEDVLEAQDDEVSRRVVAHLDKRVVRVVRKEGNDWAVDARVLADKCAKQLRLIIPAERIQLETPIATFGRHDVPVLVSDETVGALHVDIVRR